jgi:tRNA(Ile)-lysidine synthase
LRVAPALWLEPLEIRRQLVVAALRWMTGEGYAPRAADVARFMAAMSAGRPATLAGCRFARGLILREARALGGPVAVGELWDGRWRVEGPAGEVRALGAEGLRQCQDWRGTGLARQVLEVTPGVWAGDRLLAAPLAGWAQGWSARLVASDHLFGLSD